MKEKNYCDEMVCGCMTLKIKGKQSDPAFTAFNIHDISKVNKIWHLLLLLLCYTLDFEFSILSQLQAKLEWSEYWNLDVWCCVRCMTAIPYNYLNVFRIVSHKIKIEIYRQAYIFQQRQQQRQQQHTNINDTTTILLWFCW